MRYYIFTIILILSFVAIINSYANDFGPWGQEKIVGDAVVVRNNNIKRKHLHKPSTVHNGVQGGAYFMIRFFQVVISPQDGPNCRFYPVCSVYGRRAVSKHGAFWGAFLAGERLIRCNPYNPPGDDPVPDSIFGDDND